MFLKMYNEHDSLTQGIKYAKTGWHAKLKAFFTVVKDCSDV